jgi:peptide/nickel transport system permease protein
MLRFFIRRILWILPIILSVTLLTFLLSHVGGHPEAAYVTEETPPQVVEQVIERYHLDEPAVVQYWWYLKNLLKGDWGISRSSSNLPVLEAIRAYFPATLELSLLAIAIALLLSLPLGIASALRRNSWLDGAARVLSLAGVSLPIFILALLLQYLLFFRLKQAGLPHFPLGGRVTLDTALTYPLNTITGLYSLDNLLRGNWRMLLDACRHLILPAFSLAFASVGLFTRITRASMLEVLREDYITVARAKGLHEGRLIWTHALRNAVIPIATVVGLQMGRILGGTVIVETVFFFPGIGLWAVSAISASDSASIMGFVLLIAIIRTVLNLVTDFSYTLLDPRVRYQ